MPLITSSVGIDLSYNHIYGNININPDVASQRCKTKNGESIITTATGDGNCISPHYSTPGIYIISPYQSEFCVSATVCPGNCTCAPYYDGAMCASCAVGNYRYDSECHPCYGLGTLIIIMFLCMLMMSIGIIIAILYFCTSLSYKIDEFYHKVVEKIQALTASVDPSIVFIGADFVQFVSKLRSFGLSIWPPEVLSYFDGVGHTVAVTKPYSYMGVLNCIYMSSASTTHTASSVRSYYSDLFSFRLRNYMQILSLPFYTIVLYIMTWIAKSIAMCRGKKNLSKYDNSFQNYFSWMLKLIYFPSISATLELFECRYIGNYGGDVQGQVGIANGIYVNAHDPSLKCPSSYYPPLDLELWEYLIITYGVFQAMNVLYFVSTLIARYQNRPENSPMRASATDSKTSKAVSVVHSPASEDMNSKVKIKEISNSGEKADSSSATVRDSTASLPFFLRKIMMIDTNAIIEVEDSNTKSNTLVSTSNPLTKDVTMLNNPNLVKHNTIIRTISNRNTTDTNVVTGKDVISASTTIELTEIRLNTDTSSKERSCGTEVSNLIVNDNANAYSVPPSYQVSTAPATTASSSTTGVPDASIANKDTMITSVDQHPNSDHRPSSILMPIASSVTESSSLSVLYDNNILEILYSDALGLVEMLIVSVIMVPLMIITRGAIKVHLRSNYKMLDVQHASRPSIDNKGSSIPDNIGEQSSKCCSNDLTSRWRESCRVNPTLKFWLWDVT